MPCFVVLFGICCLAGCEGSRHHLKKVRLNEVAHSIFYAPQYVAIEKGYFEKEGIKLELTTGFGADKTATAVISGDADIAFMGPEATIYQFNQGNADYLINFAQLTQRAGNFVVSREKEDSFKWEDLKGKKVIGGRPGGMPEMVFEYVLKKHGMNPQKDINLVQNIDFANTSGAFVSGETKQLRHVNRRYQDCREAIEREFKGRHEIKKEVQELTVKKENLQEEIDNLNENLCLIQDTLEEQEEKAKKYDKFVAGLEAFTKEHPEQAAAFREEVAYILDYTQPEVDLSIEEER